CHTTVIKHSHSLSLYTTLLPFYFLFFFNDTATTEIYTLSLHDALPICRSAAIPATWWTIFMALFLFLRRGCGGRGQTLFGDDLQDRKSTRLNSSHDQISYAVFCLKKKKKTNY